MKPTRFFLAVLLLAGGVETGWAAWFDANYQYKRQITIDPAQVTGDQANFPVLITEADLDSTFFSHVQKNTVSNMDIIFTDGSETTKLDREIAAYDAAGNSLEAWVRIPNLSGSIATTIYMYYGYAAANEPNQTGTWNASIFAGVWHLGESSGSANDSTANNADGTFYGNLPGAEYGPIWRCQHPNGSTGYIDHGEPSALDRNGDVPLSIEAWVRFDTLGVNTFHEIVTKGDTQYALQKSGVTSNNMIFVIYDGTWWREATSNSAATTNTWYHLVGRYNLAGGHEVALFVNGVKQTATGSASRINNTSTNFNIARNADTSRYLDGLVDEVRVYAAAVSDTWISTSYYNQRDPGAFSAISAETARATPTPTLTPSPSPTRTASPTATDSATVTPTRTVTPTSTHSSTATESATFTATSTATPTATISSTATSTPTFTDTPTSSPTFTITPTFTASPTFTATPTITQTFTITPTRTHTPPYTATPTDTITVTFTITPTRTITRTRTATPTFTCTPTYTATPTITVTSTISPTRTVTPTPTDSPMITPTFTETPNVAASDLAHVIVYPNPYRSDFYPSARVVFMQLPSRVVVRIYTLDGRLVREFQKDDPGNRLVWNLDNRQGRAVASGLYIYVLKTLREEKTGKIYILR
ncbi:MAG: DUF2341 domain-containing protein [candidate division FCPU426 bacterium]